MQMLLDSIGSDPRISSWYAENLDCMDAPITPIPLGYLRSDGDFIYDSFLSFLQSRSDSGKNP